MQGIYKITNVNDGRVYVGRSIDIEGRWKDHLKDLQNNSHHSYKLQECYNTLENKNDLVFEVLEEIDERWKLPAAEQYYMNKYDAYEKGFNCSPFADNPKYAYSGMEKLNEPFVWLQFPLCTQLFPEFKNSTITRLMYIATFCGSKGYLTSDNHKVITKKKLDCSMGMPDRSFNQFWSEMTEAGMITVDEEKIFLNDEYFSKGKLYKKRSVSQTRIMVKGVRELYKNLPDARAHKRVAYIFKMLPYVNMEWSELCFNPTEEDKDFIKAMKLSTFADIVGYNVHNARRCIEDLASFNIYGQPIVKYTPDKRIVINPRLYYAGGNISNIAYDELKSIL